MGVVIPIGGRRGLLKNNRHAGLVDVFANERCGKNDVLWLKENAELLSICETGNVHYPDGALDPHVEFYENIERRISYFRQYYRFLISICLDLEDLGMPGDKAERIAHWVDRQGLVSGELSDLQRAEARRLLERRGIKAKKDGLTERLHAFIDNARNFAMPNTKIAYELTHIIFYLSEYGRRDAQISAQARVSLTHVGLLAFLDQNMDLLAEVCVAMRFVDQTPPQAWEDCLQRALTEYRFFAGTPLTGRDDYHSYFVCVWWSLLQGQAGFSGVPSGAMTIVAPATSGALRPLSRLYFHDPHLGKIPWRRARTQVLQELDASGQDLLRAAECSVPHFEDFIGKFARSGVAG